MMWAEIVRDDDDDDFSIGINYRQWKQLQKKIEEQFDSDRGSFYEVRIGMAIDGKNGGLLKDTIEMEGHALLERKRK